MTLSASDDARMFDKYIRYTDMTKYEEIEYKDLSDEGKKVI